MMEKITGSAHIRLEPVSISKVTPVEAFLGVAESLMPGMQLLINTPPFYAIPITLLAGHILECLLKAFLSKTDVSEANLKKFGHDLNKLWQEAANRKFPIPSVLPPWAKRLSELHGFPYRLRYNSCRVHGITLPNSQELSSELTKLLETVRREIR
jgi:hypothetical protein